MYMMLGFVCFGVAFLLILNRKHFPAALALTALGLMLMYGEISRHP